MTLHPDLLHFTQCVNALDEDDKVCTMCLATKWLQGLPSHLRVEMPHEYTGPVTRGNMCEAYTALCLRFLFSFFIVAARLSHHMQSHNLYETKQSVYRKGHSTETALLRIHNDLLTAADSHRASCLVPLDLSAAFDTVDHNILLTRLSENVGLSGVPLTWFASYLSRRTQTVKTGSATSKPTGLTCGVPQGSVLGPILFTIYTAVELGKIIRKYGLEYHMYADDTQLYIWFNTLETACAIAKLEKCMDEIEKWMIVNKFCYH